MVKPKQNAGPGPLESLKLKNYCEMCGATNRKKGAAPLEPAFDPGGKPKTLCRECRMGSAEVLDTQRRRPAVVTVEGGIVQSVFQVTPELPKGYLGVNYEVLDYDVLTGGSYTPDDVKAAWQGLSPQLRAYIEKHLPKEYTEIQERISAATGAPVEFGGGQPDVYKKRG